VRPPATPNSLAAVVVPTMADKLGASTFIRELTYMNIFRDVSDDARSTTSKERTFLRASSRRSARSQARSTTAHSGSESCLPGVVVAVTTTLMMIAGGRTPVRSTLVKSYNRDMSWEKNA